MTDAGSGQSEMKQAYSLRELVNAAREYLNALKTSRHLLGWLVLIGLVFGIWSKWKSTKVYEAELSFMLNEEAGSFPGLSNALGGFSGLLGAGDQINLYKILDLARSRRIAGKLLFEKIKLEDAQQEDFLANYLIIELEHQGKWAESKFYQPAHPLKGFRFHHDQLQSFSRLENMALQQVHSALDAMLTTRLSDKTNLMYLNLKGCNEVLTHVLCLRLFDQLSRYYIDQTVEKQLETYRGLSHKTDSLKALIEHKQYGLAGLKDHYRSGWLLSEEVPKTLLDQDIRILQMVYGEAMKNKEVASFSLLHKTPFIQAIDLPIQPLKSKQLSWPKALIGGLLMGLVVGSLIVWIRKFCNDHKIFE